MPEKMSHFLVIVFALLALATSDSAFVLAETNTTDVADNDRRASDSSKGGTVDANRSFLNGKQFLEANQLREAAAAFKQSLQLDDTNDDCRLLYAICLYKLNRNYGALGQLEALVNKDPENAEGFLYLGHCYAKIGKIAEAVDAYQRYLKLKPDAPERDKYRSLIGALDDQRKRQDEKTRNDESNKASRDAAVQGNVPPVSSSVTASGDYLKEVFEKGVYRWPLSRMPITVYITPGDKVRGYEPEFDDILRHAFSEWTSTTGGKIKFKIVNARAEARLIVTWTDDLHAPELTAEAGITHINQDFEGISDGDIRLLTLDPLRSGPVGHTNLYNICLHEIGHALGLMGHSPYPSDIMYPVMSVQTGISPRDAATLCKIYSSEFSQGQNAGDAANGMGFDEQTLARMTARERAEILLKQGTNACFAGRYEDSIKLLEKSLAIDPTNDLARRNLSVAANNLAIKKEISMDERMKLLRKALYWYPQSEISRVNLENYLKFMQFDPGNFTQRVKLADGLEQSGDLEGAIVELSEASRIKPDKALDERIQRLKKQMAKS